MPGKLREYLRLIHPCRMKLIAMKLSVGSIVKYFDNLTTPKKSRLERRVRIGNTTNLDKILTEILNFHKTK